MDGWWSVYAWNGCTLTHAFRWEESTGMVDLGSSVAGRASLATGVSGDGKVVVGYQEARDRLPPGRAVGGRSAGTVSRSGWLRRNRERREQRRHDRGWPDLQRRQRSRPTDPNFQSAWVWTTRDGTQCLPAPSLRASPGPLIIVEANATSDDGRVIGGGQNVGGSQDSNAVIWIDRLSLLLEGLPAGPRRAGRVRELGQHRSHHRHFAGWPHPGRLRRRARRLPRLHRDSRRQAMNRLTACAMCHRPAGAVRASVGAIVGGVRPGRLHPLGRPRPSSAGTDSARHPRRVYVGRSGGAFVHAAVGRRGAVDAAVVGAPDRHRRRDRGSLHDDRSTAARQRGCAISAARTRGCDSLRFAGLGATFFSADDLESETKFSLGLGGGVKYFPWKAIGVRGHFRYKPTMLNDEDAGRLLRPVRLLSRLAAADRVRRRRRRPVLSSDAGHFAVRGRTANPPSRSGFESGFMAPAAVAWMNAGPDPSARRRP